MAGANTQGFARHSVLLFLRSNSFLAAVIFLSLAFLIVASSPFLLFNFLRHRRIRLGRNFLIAFRVSSGI